jgi:hypothetical protein
MSLPNALRFHIVDADVVDATGGAASATLQTFTVPRLEGQREFVDHAMEANDRLVTHEGPSFNPVAE